MIVPEAELHAQEAKEEAQLMVKEDPAENVRTVVTEAVQLTATNVVRVEIMDHLMVTEKAAVMATEAGHPALLTDKRKAILVIRKTNHGEINADNNKNLH